MPKQRKSEEIVPKEVDEEVLPVKFQDFLDNTNVLHVAAEHVKEEQPKHYATFIRNKEMLTRVARRMYMAFYTMHKVRKTEPFKSIKVHSDCPGSVLDVIFNVPTIFKKSHRKKQTNSNAVKIPQYDDDLVNPQPSTSKMAFLKMHQLQSNRVALKEQDLNKQSCVEFLKKPINPERFRFPVTEAEFKKYSFCDEVVDQILNDLACGNEAKYKKLQSDQGKRKLIFRNYYQAFYLRPDVREQFKLRLKPCPKQIKENILKKAISEDTDVAADDPPVVEDSQILEGSPARKSTTSAAEIAQICQIRSKQTKVNEFFLGTRKSLHTEPDKTAAVEEVATARTEPLLELSEQESSQKQPTASGGTTPLDDGLGDPVNLDNTPPRIDESKFPITLKDFLDSTNILDVIKAELEKSDPNSNVYNTDRLLVIAQQLFIKFYTESRRQAIFHNMIIRFGVLCERNIVDRFFEIPRNTNPNFALQRNALEIPEEMDAPVSPQQQHSKSSQGHNRTDNLDRREKSICSISNEDDELPTEKKENTSRVRAAAAKAFPGSSKTKRKISDDTAEEADSQSEEKVDERAKRRKRDDDGKTVNPVTPAPKKQSPEVTGGERPTGVQCSNQVTGVSPIRKQQRESSLVRLESSVHRQTQPSPTDAKEVELILQSIELPLVNFEEFESELPVSYNEFRKHIRVRELFEDIVKDIAKEDNDKYLSLMKQHNLKSSIIQSFYVQFYLNPAIRNKYKVQFICCPKKRKDRILQIPENTEALTMCRKKIQNQKTETASAGKKQNKLFVLSHQLIERYVTVKYGNGSKRSEIIQRLQREVSYKLTSSSRVQIQSVVKLPPVANMKLLKAKELFFKDVDKRCSLPYVLRTTHGIKHRIIRAVLQMSFEEFGVYTRIHNAPEIYKDKATLERCYRRAIVEPQVWPVNLYIPLADLWAYLKLKCVPVTHDLTSISPKLLHWADLSACTNFDDCVRFDYLKRTAIQIDSKEVELNAREHYYNRCWVHEQWIWQTPLLKEASSLNEIETSGNVERPQRHGETLKQWPTVKKFLEQKRDNILAMNRKLAEIFAGTSDSDSTDIVAYNGNISGYSSETCISTAPPSPQSLSDVEYAEKSSTDPEIASAQCDGNSQNIYQPVVQNESAMCSNPMVEADLSESDQVLSLSEEPTQLNQQLILSPVPPSKHNIKIYMPCTPKQLALSSEEYIVPDRLYQSYSVNNGLTQDLNLTEKYEYISASPVKQERVLKMPDKVRFFIDDADEVHCESFSENVIEISDDVIEIPDDVIELPKDVVEFPDHVVEIPDEVVEIPDEVVEIPDDAIEILDEENSIENLAVTLVNVDATSVSKNFIYSALQNIQHDFGTIPKARRPPSSLEGATTMGSNSEPMENEASTTPLFMAEISRAEISSIGVSPTMANVKQSAPSTVRTGRLMPETEIERVDGSRFPAGRKPPSRIPKPMPKSFKKKYYVGELVPQLTHQFRPLPVTTESASNMRAATKTADTAGVPVSARNSKDSTIQTCSISQALATDATLFNSSELLRAANQPLEYQENLVPKTNTDNNKASSEATAAPPTSTEVKVIRTPASGEKFKTLLFCDLQQFHYFEALTKENIIKYQLPCICIGERYSQALIKCGRQTKLYGDFLPTLLAHCPASLVRDVQSVLRDLREYHYSAFLTQEAISGISDLRERVLFEFFNSWPTFTHSHLKFDSVTHEYGCLEPITPYTDETLVRRPHRPLTDALKPAILEGIRNLKARL